ncbi:MAG: PQQ-dependent sugar dehydrogenase [Deltaproteobacteria bacterium]|nr:PQQ-dependent sugar dehydrogenase [Deltaproteobacteria bacterium]
MDVWIAGRRRSARRIAPWLVMAMTLAAGCRDDDGQSLPFENRCVALPKLPGADRVRVEPRFGQIAIEDGVALVQHPSDDARWYLVTKPGVVYTWRGDAAATVFADLSARVHIAGEAGLLDLAFDPAFADNGRVFLSYNAEGGTAMLSRIAVATSDDDGRTLATDGLLTVIEIDQPYENHNGGDIDFGNDGMLYLGLGDGGSAGDPQGNGQRRDTLLGKMIRIDVRDTSEASPYAVPPDNPFVDEQGTRPEIWALGFRNPWRWSFDRPSGALWAGDVGQHRYEEVDRVTAGGNYGWGVKEGTDCIGVDACDDPSFIDPVAQYRNTGVASIIAGAVLRGGTIPAFEGSFVWSDFYDGTTWRVPAAGGEAEIIGSSARGIAGWTLARDGTLMGVSYFGGVVALVAGADDAAGVDRFPRLLSQTGCVDMDAPTQPAMGVVPYAVNLPFWSDGADKLRAVAVPEGTVASVDDDGLVQWPTGTVLVKSFERGGVLLETRLLARHDDGWVGYGYAWDPDGGEARLVTDEGTAPRDDTWLLPGLRGCRACHTDAAGGPLGTTAAQLAHRDDDGTDQLAQLVAQGLLDAVPEVAPLPAADDAAVALDTRVRAYLAVNCSPCHREDGTGGRADLDLRREVALADTGLCNAPRAGDVGLTDPQIVAPGEPARSVLSVRLHAEGDARMPPLATARVDADAAALVDAWIEGLASCP